MATTVKRKGNIGPRPETVEKYVKFLTRVQVYAETTSGIELSRITSIQKEMSIGNGPLQYLLHKFFEKKSSGYRKYYVWRKDNKYVPLKRMAVEALEDMALQNAIRQEEKKKQQGGAVATKPEGTPIAMVPEEEFKASLKTVEGEDEIGKEAALEYLGKVEVSPAPNLRIQELSPVQSVSNPYKAVIADLGSKKEKLKREWKQQVDIIANAQLRVEQLNSEVNKVAGAIEQLEALMPESRTVSQAPERFSLANAQA